MEDNQATATALELIKDCVNGHVGVKVKDLYDEVADDRYYRIWIYRCSHCSLPLGDVPESEYPDVA